MKFLLLMIALILVVGCTDPQGATRTLENQGYTEIRITGYRWFAGSESDCFVTGFRAKSPIGKPVSGVVTRGLILKSSTIRFD